MPNWNEILTEIHSYPSGLDSIRRKYLSLLNKHTKRNVIVYYSGFLSKPRVAGGEITDEDKNGLMMAVHGLDRKLGLDLILHTPGGSIASTQSIVSYLHAMFGHDIHAIIPQIAMSAGTMIACSCKKIYMAKHSNLGPIDPQLAGLPALGVIQEFKRALKEIKGDPQKMAVWRPILEKYHPTFLSQCENAVQWSNAFVREQLANVMFEGESDRKAKAARVVQKLANYSRNKMHEKHLHANECINIGLKIEMIENDDKLQDLILTVHHCCMHVFMNGPAFKMIENHNGTAYIRNVVG